MSIFTALIATKTWAGDISTISTPEETLLLGGVVPRGVFFKPDGSEVYILTYIGIIITVPLSTPWDISTVSSYIAADESEFADGRGIFFSVDGSKMYLCIWVNREVREFDLATPWDVSTASLTYYSFSEANSNKPNTAFFSRDGTRMYLGCEDGKIAQYSLATEWDLSTASHVRTVVHPIDNDQVTGIYFSPAGDQMYTIMDEWIYQTTLATPWNISTAGTYTAEVIGEAYEMMFNNNGTKLYVMGFNELNQYLIGA